jgi:hypothetical protein
MQGKFLLAVVGLVLGLAAASPASAQGLDRTASPNYGTVTLTSPWRPNPHQVTLVAGGDQQVSNIVSGCTGWITGQPDFVMTLYAPNGTRSFDITATSGADVTLIVQGPDNQFTCNDDSDGANPRVSFANPQSGAYAVWVGTYADEDADAVLSFTEH